MIPHDFTLQAQTSRVTYAIITALHVLIIAWILSTPQATLHKPQQLKVRTIQLDVPQKEIIMAPQVVHEEVAPIPQVHEPDFEPIVDPVPIQIESPPQPAPVPVKTSTQQVKKAASKVQPQVQKKAATPKKEVAKKIVKKAAEPKQKITAQKTQQNRKALIQDALTKLQSSSKSDAEITKYQNKQVTSTQTCGTITALAVDSVVAVTASEESNLFSKTERTYYDELVSRLQLSLRLPEFGQVKLKLTISREGVVTAIQIISTKSMRNKEYVQKMLAKLTFPKFGNNFQSEKEHTFNLNLNNAL